jgi:hypothetical protein
MSESESENEADYEPCYWCHTRVETYNDPENWVAWCGLDRFTTCDKCMETMCNSCHGPCDNICERCEQVCECYWHDGEECDDQCNCTEEEKEEYRLKQSAKKKEKPKRMESKYNTFFKNIQPSIKAANPTWSPQQVTTEIGRLWSLETMEINQMNDTVVVTTTKQKITLDVCGCPAELRKYLEAYRTKHGHEKCFQLIQQLKLAD